MKLRELIHSDAATYLDRKAGLYPIIQLFVTQPGFRCVTLFRLQEAAVKRDIPLLPSLIRIRILRLFGADFVPGITAGPGLNIQHPQGIVLGQGARLGANCTLLQNVTLGEDLKKNPGRYPTIGDGCTLGAGSIVIGPVTLGRGSTVGANAVVLKSFGDGATIIGVPARQTESS